MCEITQRDILECKCGLFARLECTREGLVYECLDEHLVNVALAAGLIARRVYKRFLNDTDIGYVILASLLHDVGKIIRNLSLKDRVERIVEKCGTDRIVGQHISFTYHEIFSTALHGFYNWITGRSSKIVSRAILLHHQGLRGLETRSYLEGLAMISDDIAKIKEDVHTKLTCLLEHVKKRFSNAINVTLSNPSFKEELGNALSYALDELNKITSFLSNTSITVILENASALLGTWIGVDVREAEKARIIAGILMIADNGIVRSRVPRAREASLYVNEAEWVTRRFASEVFRHNATNAPNVADCLQ